MRDWMLNVEQAPDRGSNHGRPPRGSPDKRTDRTSGSRARNKTCEFAFLEMLIKSPTLHLSHHIFELRFRDRFVDEPLAAREFAEIPTRCLEFSRYRQLPERKIFSKVCLQRVLGPIEGFEIFG